MRLHRAYLNEYSNSAILPLTHFHTLLLLPQELRWLWKKRAGMPWGMPFPKFNLKHSLLLLDSDHDIPDDAEIVERPNKQDSAGSAGSAGSGGTDSVFSDIVEEEDPEIVYDTCHGGLYGAGGPMYYKLFGDECITGEPRGPFPITQKQTLANGSVVTTTISAIPWSTATTTTVTITHPGDATSPTNTNSNTDAGSTSPDARNGGTTNSITDTSTDTSMLEKEYVLRMPSYMSFNELHEKQKEGFLFDGEVSAMKVEFFFLPDVITRSLALIRTSCTPPPARITLTPNIFTQLHHTPYTVHHTPYTTHIHHTPYTVHQ